MNPVVRRAYFESFQQKEKNPLMLSPDYAFRDDLEERKKYKDELKKKGLLIN